METPSKGRSGLSCGRGTTIAGLLIGFGLGCAAMAVSESTETEESVGFMRGVLYSLSELAVDTEINAKRIEALSERINTLESALADLELDKSAAD